MTDTANPETGAVDAPASMDSVLAELSAGTPAPDAADDAVKELVEQTDNGQAEAADDGAGETETATEEEQPDKPDDGSQPEADQPKPSERYTVKVGGEERKVTLDELKAGYSRGEDYTAKTMALSDERRGLEAKLSDDYASKLKQTTDLFVQLDPLLAQADQIDWQALAQEDPATYTQLRAAMDARREAIGKARQEMERVSQEAAQREQAEMAQRSKAEADALVKAMPELADPAKMGAFANETVGYLKATGFADPEIAELLDHRALVIVDKARRWDAQQKAKAALPAKKVVQTPAKPLRSDASSTSQTPRKLSPSANSEARAAFVVQELLGG
jgi:hypothetical protein